MTEYDPYEVEAGAEVKKSLDIHSLRRLGYDFENNQLLLEGRATDLESLSGDKTDLDDLPAISDVAQIEGAMVNVVGNIFVAQSLLTRADELIENNPERLKTIANAVSAIMEQSFDAAYPELLEDMYVSGDILRGFQLSVRNGGIPTLVTFGDCACLGYEPDGMGSGLPIEELSFHNIDSRVNQRLGQAQLTSLFAGLAAYSELIQAEYCAFESFI